MNKFLLSLVVFFLGLNASLFAQEKPDVRGQIELLANLLQQKTKPVFSAEDTSYSVSFSGGWVMIGWRVILVCPTAKGKVRHVIIFDRSEYKRTESEGNWARLDTDEKCVFIYHPFYRIGKLEKDSVELINAVGTKALNFLFSLPDRK